LADGVDEGGDSAPVPRLGSVGGGLDTAAAPIRPTALAISGFEA
jgi:hypothetical protein